MGSRRPRYSVFGLLVLVAVAWGHGASSSEQARPPAVRGDVSAAGEPVGVRGWRVDRLGVGVYRVRVPGSSGRLDVPTWNAAADVTIIPMGGDVAEIRFVAAGEPVDTDFEVVTDRR